MIKAKVHPKKSLGQNFLKDENVARKIIASLGLETGDCVLEIGPGMGVLTKYLVEKAKKVVAVEIDKNLVLRLQQQFRSVSNFVLYQNDILKVVFEQILAEYSYWKVVGNLPYHITSPVLFKLFEQRQYLDSAILMIQKEVAVRIAAQPGSKDYGILSVFSQFYSIATKLFDVSRHVFSPKPDVTSAVVRLEFKKAALLDRREEIIFCNIVKGTFNQRRKMLRNSLLAIPDLKINLDQVNFDLTQRPEQLSVSDFVELTEKIVGQVANQSYI